MTRDRHVIRHVHSMRGLRAATKQPIGCRAQKLVRVIARLLLQLQAPTRKSELADVASDLFDWAPREELFRIPKRFSRRRTFEGTSAITLAPIAVLKTIGKSRHGRTERPVGYGEDETIARDCNSSTASSSRRTRARNSTTSS